MEFDYSDSLGDKSTNFDKLHYHLLMQEISSLLASQLKSRNEAGINNKFRLVINVISL